MTMPAKPSVSVVARSAPPPPVAATPIRVAAAVRELTAEERVRVRFAMTRHFDDVSGRYHAGYADDRIAAELRVPVQRVAEIRATAYGAPSRDPEIAAMRAELAGLERDAAALVRQVLPLQEAMASLRARLTAIETTRNGKKV